MSGIAYIDYYLPSNRATIEDVLNLTNEHNEKNNYAKFKEEVSYIKEMSKSEEIFYEENDVIIKVFEGLLDKFFYESGVNPLEIKAIFFSDINNFKRDKINVPYYLQSKYNMDNATVISVNQQCSGATLGMMLSNNFLLEDKKEYVIILSSCFMKSMDDRYLGDCIAGDGAGIVVLSNKDYHYKICESKSISSGDASFSKYTGVEKSFSSIKTVKITKTIVRGILEKCNIASKDVDVFIFQNTNVYLQSNIFTKSLKIDNDKIFTKNNLCGGHIGDVDIIRNLKDYIDDEINHESKYIMLYSIGSFGFVDCDRNYAGILLESMK